MMRFKESRERAGLTQKEAAISLDVSVQAVSYWETGSRMPSVDKILQMCDLYNVSADYLLGRDVIHMIKEEPHDITPPPVGYEQIVMTLDPQKSEEEQIEQMVARIVKEQVDAELKKRGI